MLKKIQLYTFLIGLFVYMSQPSFSQITNPLDITGIAGWYSSDSIISTNGSPVMNWFDLSTNNNHLTQSTGLNQGIYITNQLNNKPCIRLNGTNSFYSFTDSVDFRTVIVVGKVNESSFADYRGLFGGTLSSVAIGGYLINGVGGSTFIGQGVNASIFSKLLKNNVSVLPVGDFNPLSTYWVGDFEFLFNRKQLADMGRIDNGNNLGRYWIGDIFEIIIYNKTLSTIESDDIFNYLCQKYAPPVILPSDIVVSNSLCDTVIATNSNFESYIWSTGATTPTISVNVSGKYWVEAINVFGKISSDTILVTYPGNFLNQNFVLCQGDSLIWNTNLPNNQYLFQWQDNSLDSLFTVNQGGLYYVKVTDGSGCSVNSNTITVTQDNFSTTASLGIDTSLCSGNLITLTSGAAPSLTYTWSTGSINDSLLITNSGQYSVVVTNTNNCVAKDTIIVTISGFAPTANFTSSIGCKNSPVYFTNLSVAPSTLTPIDSTLWNFGDSAIPATNTSTLSNPSHTFSDTGTYVVRLRVITSAGCEQLIIKTVHVSPIPTPSFAIVGPSCQNSVTQFTNQSTGLPGYSVTSSAWNFGDFTTSTLTSPNHTYTNNIQHIASLLVTNSVGCSASISRSVTVNAEVKATFTNSPACLNAPTVFQSTSIAPSATATFSWNLGGSSPTTAMATKTYTNSGVNSVTLYVDGNNGCTSSITKLINVYLPPIASFSIPSFCSKDTINIINTSNAQSGVLSTYNWKLNNVFFSFVQNPTLSLITPTTYSVRLSVANSFGCKDSTTKTVTVFPLPIVDFTTNPAAYYYLNSPITFSPTTANASAYTWNITGVSTTTIQSPVATFTNIGSYTVSLNLQDQQGCKGSKTKTITVTNRYLDLAILNVTTLKDNDGFMTVIADLANYGSVPISTFDMHYQISDAGNIKETWNGTLNPNTFYQYTFNSRSASVQNSTNNITCVEIEKVNTVIDQNITNNKLCNALNINDISVSNPLPNPAEGDIILPITLNRDLDYTIAIYNSIGQIQYEETTEKGLAGLNFVSLPTASYARACYIIKVMIDGKVFIKKFIKTSYE